MNQLPGREIDGEEDGKAVMANSERRGLVWDIKKSLLTLTADELFQLAQRVGPVPGKGPSTLQVGDEYGCFEHVDAFMNSDALIDSEDSGMAVLLELNDTVNDVIQARNAQTKTVTDVEMHNVMSVSENVATGQSAVVSDVTTDDATDRIPNTNTPNQAEVSPATPSPPSTTTTPQNTDIVELQKMFTSLLQHISNPISPPTPTLIHPTPPSDTKHTPEHAHDRHNRVVPLRDLPMLRREFKVQGGQIGDQSSDLSYNNICRQIDDGLKDRFTEIEILRGVLRIIKPGHFKDMLMHKDDLTIDELKGFLQSHLGGRSHTELFQELMCTRQNDNESPSSFCTVS